MMQVPKQSYAV